MRSDPLDFHIPSTRTQYSSPAACTWSGRRAATRATIRGRCATWWTGYVTRDCRAYLYVRMIKHLYAHTSQAVFPDQTQALSGPTTDDASGRSHVDAMLPMLSPACNSFGSSDITPFPQITPHTYSGTITWPIALPIPTRVPPTLALPRPNGPVVGVTYTLTAKLLPPSRQGETPVAEAKKEVFVLPTEDGCLFDGAAAVEARAALEKEEESAVGHQSPGTGRWMQIISPTTRPTDSDPNHPPPQKNINRRSPPSAASSRGGASARA